MNATNRIRYSLIAIAGLLLLLIGAAPGPKEQHPMIDYLEHTTTPGTGADGAVNTLETTQHINGKILAVHINLVNCPSEIELYVRDKQLVGIHENGALEHYIIKLENYTGQLADYNDFIVYPTHYLNHTAADTFVYNYTELKAGAYHAVNGPLQIDLQDANDDSYVTIGVWFEH